MSSTSVLEALLAQMNKSSSPTPKKIPALTHYSGGKSGSVAPYSGKSVVNPKTSKGSTHDGGILGGIKKVGENFASDVVHGAIGIPGGIVETVTHPIATGEAIAKDYKTRYGPLLGYLNGGGNITKFAKQAEAHPLSYALDASALLTGGGSLAAKIGQSAKIADDARLADAAASPEAARAIQHPALTKLYKATTGKTRMISADSKALEADKTVPVPISGNPVKAFRRNALLNLQESKLIPDKTPFLGIAPRANRLGKLEQMSRAGVVRAPGRAIEAHVAQMQKKYTPAEYVAAASAADHIASGATSFEDHAAVIKSHLMDNKDAIMKSHDLDAQGFNALVKHRTEALSSDTSEGREAQALTTATQRTMQQRAMARDGLKIPAAKLKGKADDPNIESPLVKDTIKLHDLMSQAADDSQNQLVKAGLLSKDEASQRAVLHYVITKSLTGGLKDESPAAVNKLFDEAGLPRPIYNPDRVNAGQVTKLSSLNKTDTGELYKSGARSVDPLHMAFAHSIASQASDLENTHEILRGLATRIEPGKTLPHGYVWLNDTLKGPATKVFNESEHGGPLTTEEFNKALFHEGAPTESRLAIPSRVKGEFAGTHQAINAGRSPLVSTAVNGWRRLVLTRPGFLTTNMGSNQLMFHAFHGVAPRALAGAKREEEALDEFHHAEMKSFGDEAVGERPKTLTKTRKVKDSLFRLVGAHEHWMRRMSAYETIRKLPQFKTEMRALKGGAYDATAHGDRSMFHEALRRTYAKSPHLRGLVSKQMDDVLGNYRYFTALERNLKTLSPFYSWQRHSTRTFARFLEDRPATAALAMQVGMQGDKRYKKDFGADMPQFAENYVKGHSLGWVMQQLGMKGNTIDLTNLNPFDTAISAGRAAQELTNGGYSGAGTKYGNLTALLGPLAVGPLEAYTGKSALTGAPITPGVSGQNSSSAQGMLERVLTALPQFTAAHEAITGANAQKKMLPATRSASLSDLFGVNVRDPNIKDMKTMAKRQKTLLAAEQHDAGRPQPKKKKKVPLLTP